MLIVKTGPVLIVRTGPAHREDWTSSSWGLDQCSSWGLSFQLILSIIFFTKITLKLDTNYGLFFQLSMKICPLNNSCVKQNKKNLNYLYLQTDTFLQQLLDKHNMCHVETWHFARFLKTLHKIGIIYYMTYLLEYLKKINTKPWNSHTKKQRSIS